MSVSEAYIYDADRCDPDVGIWSAGQRQGLIGDVPTPAESVKKMMTEDQEITTSRLAGMVETKEALR